MDRINPCQSAESTLTWTTVTQGGAEARASQCAKHPMTTRTVVGFARAARTCRPRGAAARVSADGRQCCSGWPGGNAPGQPEQEAAAHQVQPELRAQQPGDQPADAICADGAIDCIGECYPQRSGQGRQADTVQRAVDGQQSNRTDRHGDRQPDQLRSAE